MFVTNEEKEKVISIGLIDNYAIMRMGLSMIFQEGFKRVRVTEAETLAEFAANSATDADVILLGINNATTEECLLKAAGFRAAFPRQKLIIYDEQLDFNLITGYFKLGINGYIGRNNGEKEMVQCVESVLLGRFHLGHELTTALLTQLTRTTPRIRMQNNLSGRESEIAGYLCQGMKTSAIAQTLSRKPSTVSTIKHNILKKMNVNNIVELMTAMQQPGARFQRNR